MLKGHWTVIWDALHTYGLQLLCNFDIFNDIFYIAQVDLIRHLLPVPFPIRNVFTVNNKYSAILNEYTCTRLLCFSIHFWKNTILKYTNINILLTTTYKYKSCHKP
jgi:hypothetical protein